MSRRKGVRFDVTVGDPVSLSFVVSASHGADDPMGQALSKMWQQLESLGSDLVLHGPVTIKRRAQS